METGFNPKERPRMTSYEVVREGISFLHKYLGLFVVATLIFMVMSSVANAPIQILQQIQLERIRESSRQDQLDPLMFFRPPWIWWYFATIPFGALTIPFRVTMTRMALRAWKGNGPPDLSDMFALDGRYWSLVLYGLIESVVLTIAFLAFVAPAIFIYPLFVCAGMLVLERKLTPIEAIRESARAVRASYWAVMGATIVAGLYAAIGVLLCCVGILITGAIVEIVPALIYRDLFEPSQGTNKTEVPSPAFET
ncbi:MAG TPA: hypothetical protein PLX06_08945 [Fimbriimonadaceae bacterium]|nr:hypothetical protein [Fimbriimonadaceae bacterium]